MKTLTALLLAAAMLVAAAPLADLLEQGIYAQETLGDLDKAIQIYQQVADQAGESRTYGAQALYRLILCYGRKGQPADAKAALDRLTNSYPEEKELVAQAREQLSDTVALLPAPWEDREQLRLVLRMAGGLRIGVDIFSIGREAANGLPSWHTRHLVVAGNSQSLSEVTAEAETFRPLSSSWRHSLLGHATALYHNGKVDLDVKKQLTKTLEVDGAVYDNEHAMYLMRRLPLQPGYKTDLRVVSAFAGMVIPVPLHVTGIERVETAAGRFECHRVNLKLGAITQTFWFSTATPRYLVKYEANNVVGELEEIGRWERDRPVEYTDSNRGYSLRAPAGWELVATDTTGNAPEALLRIVDPNLLGESVVGVTQRDEHTPLRPQADRKLVADAKIYADFQVRPASWQTKPVNGVPGLSSVADFTDKGEPKVACYTWVGEKGLSALFVSRVPASGFDEFKPKFDRVVESYRILQ